MEWQSIESAPNDGRIVFGANCKTGQRGMVHYNEQGEWELIDGLTNLPMGIGFYPTHWHHLLDQPHDHRRQEREER